MKTVKLYFGSDTYGVNYELAILEGKHYHRNMVFNGYGKGWGKWKLVNDFSGTFYTDQYAQLTFGISSGSGHVGMSTTILNQYALNVTNQVNQFWAETHQTPAPEYR